MVSIVEAKRKCCPRNLFKLSQTEIRFYASSYTLVYLKIFHEGKKIKKTHGCK